ncbi:M50 family metallopeptidase [Streptomyces sp. M19]
MVPAAGGVRPPFELQRKRRYGGARDSDADQLARLTGAPAAMWLLLFHIVSLCSLFGGAAGCWTCDAGREGRRAASFPHHTVSSGSSHTVS